MQNHQRLSIEEFGKILIQSNDLDPVYCALYTMMEGDVLSQEHLSRWILAYSCLYHCGVASYLSEFEGEAFFKALMVAAWNEEPSPVGERWPRGHERRHWRGAQAVDSCKALWDRYHREPEHFLDYVIWQYAADGERGHPTTFADISERVRTHRGFGGWIAFKLADMIDRLQLRRVEFNYDDVTIYTDPVKAAERLVRQRNGFPETASVKPEAVKAVFEALEEHFSNYPAPPVGDRPIGLQEVESILCKWKSHMNGHYPLYNDIREIREGLLPWAEVSEVAGFFRAAMPKLPAEKKVAA